MTQMGFGRENPARVAKSGQPLGLTREPGTRNLPIAGLEVTPDRTGETERPLRWPEGERTPGFGVRPAGSPERVRRKPKFLGAFLMLEQPPRPSHEKAAPTRSIGRSRLREISSADRENRIVETDSAPPTWSIVPTSLIGETQSVAKPEGSRKRRLPRSSADLARGPGRKTRGGPRPSGRTQASEVPTGNRKRPRSGGSATSHSLERGGESGGVERRRKDLPATLGSHRRRACKRANRLTPSGVTLPQGSSFRARFLQGSENPERAEASAEAPSGFLASGPFGGGPTG